MQFQAIIQAHRLPMAIVNPTILEQQLLRLIPELKRRNMEFTHYGKDYSMYYHLILVSNPRGN